MFCEQHSTRPFCASLSITRRRVARSQSVCSRNTIKQRFVLTMTASGSISSEEMNIEFIKAVEQRPYLYNIDLEDYCRKSVTDNGWDEIARQFDVSG